MCFASTPMAVSQRCTALQVPALAEVRLRARRQITFFAMAYPSVRPKRTSFSIYEDGPRSPRASGRAPFIVTMPDARAKRIVSHTAGPSIASC
jgi:hypothetical protein